MKARKTKSSPPSLRKAFFGVTSMPLDELLSVDKQGIRKIYIGGKKNFWESRGGKHSLSTPPPSAPRDNLRACIQPLFKQSL